MNFDLEGIGIPDSKLAREIMELGVAAINVRKPKPTAKKKEASKKRPCGLTKTNPREFSWSNRRPSL